MEVFLTYRWVGMKKKYFTTQHGLTLIELIIGITLMLLVLHCTVDLFSGSIKVWIYCKNQSHIQQTARIAMDTIVREIRYARQITFKNTSSLIITKKNGEIKTLQLGGGLHSRTLYLITDKTKAVPPGGISTNPITENLVTNLQFTPCSQSENNKAVLITVEITDESTRKKNVLHTACYPLNYH
jgi:type II secretory pathway pseudopilin PulG